MPVTEHRAETTVGEDVELVISMTKHTFYRNYVTSGDPKYSDAWVKRVREMAARMRAGAWQKSSPGQPRPPSLGRQAVNALGAAGRVVKAVATGRQVFSTPEERARRLAVCQGTTATPKCESYNPASGRCSLTGGCGCVAKWKAMLESEVNECPRGKW
jgi:hypothetical protein